MQNLRYSFALLIIATSSAVMAQSITSQIVDSQSNAPVQFAHIHNLATDIVTVSNDAGDFLISAAPGDSIVISHLSYERRVFLAKNIPGKIVLTLKVVQLAEVTVSDFAMKLMKKTYESALLRLSVKNYSEAFYRQFTTVNNIASEIQEAFYDLETTTAGVQKSALKQGRFAVRKRDSTSALTFHFSNFSNLMMGSKIINPAKSSERKILSPFMPDAADFYSFYVKLEYQSGSKKYTQINFDPIEGVSKSALRGHCVINALTLEILEYDVYLSDNLGMESVKFGSGESAKARDHVFHFTYSFRETEAEKLSSVRGSAIFNFVTDQKYNVEVKAMLLAFEDITKKPKKLKNMDLNKDDIQEIRKKKYDPEFWKANPIILRTPLENQIIKNFETSGYFGTMSFNH